MFKSIGTLTTCDYIGLPTRKYWKLNNKHISSHLSPPSSIQSPFSLWCKSLLMFSSSTHCHSLPCIPKWLPSTAAIAAEPIARAHSTKWGRVAKNSGGNGITGTVSQMWSAARHSENKDRCFYCRKPARELPTSLSHLTSVQYKVARFPPPSSLQPYHLLQHSSRGSAIPIAVSAPTAAIPLVTAL